MQSAQSRSFERTGKTRTAAADRAVVSLQIVSVKLLKAIDRQMRWSILSIAGIRPDAIAGWRTQGE